MNYPQNALNFLLDTLFPIKCVNCGVFSRPQQRNYICKKCFGGIDIRKKFECIGCNAAVQFGKTCFKCEKTNSLDQIFSVCDYNNPLVVKLIKTFKYRFITDIADPLALLLKKYIFWLNKEKGVNILSDNPLILPVPLFYRRLNWRGFNQAELIARILGDNLYTTFEPDVIIRTIETKPQADISEREERIENIKNIFRIIRPEKIKKRSIVLVDDVCTTGTTLNHCAKALKDAGACKVIGFVIARG